MPEDAIHYVSAALLTIAKVSHGNAQHKTLAESDGRMVLYMRNIVDYELANFILSSSASYCPRSHSSGPLSETSHFLRHFQ